MTTATNNQNPFMVNISEQGEFERLEDGVYEGTLALVTARPYRAYNNPDQTQIKVHLVFQVANGGQCFYLKTRPLTPAINEKSNIALLLQSWFGCNYETLAKKGGFDLSTLIGLPAQVVVNTVTGKDGKEYANLANVLKAKKGQATTVVPDAIPAYLVKDVAACVLAQGLTVKEETQQPAAPAAPAQTAQQAPFTPAPAPALAAAPQFVPDDRIPDFGMANHQAQMRQFQQQQAMPGQGYPPGAQVSQVPTGLGFGQPAAPMVTSPAAAPAPSSTQGDISEDDLPF